MNDENPKEISTMTTSPLMESLKDFWKQEEIDIIHSLFKYAIKNDDDEKTFYLDMIEKIISNKEKKLHDYIQSVSTKY